MRSLPSHALAEVAWLFSVTCEGVMFIGKTLAPPTDFMDDLLAWFIASFHLSHELSLSIAWLWFLSALIFGLMIFVVRFLCSHDVDRPDLHSYDLSHPLPWILAYYLPSVVFHPSSSFLLFLSFLIFVLKALVMTFLVTLTLRPLSSFCRPSSSLIHASLTFIMVLLILLVFIVLYPYSRYFYRLSLRPYSLYYSLSQPWRALSFYILTPDLSRPLFLLSWPFPLPLTPMTLIIPYL